MGRRGNRTIMSTNTNRGRMEGGTEKRPNEAGEPEAKKQKRLPKKKFAVMCGYIGTGYSGLQRNPGVVTIEDELEKAMFEAGMISEDNFGDLSKSSWTRAARTDKGVHAVGQVLGVKLQVVAEDMAAALNEKLPDHIRAFVIRQATRNFHAKNGCDKRRYEYVCPSSCFAPRGTGIQHVMALHVLNEAALDTGEDAEAEQQPAPEPDTSEERVLGVHSDANLDPSIAPHPIDPSLPTIETYRMPADTLAEVRELLRFYQGTHSFHNFTTNRATDDPSCRRFMLAVGASEPFLVGEVEYLRLTFEGQSFMLHQIRKMVGMVMGVMRGVMPREMLLAALLVPNERVKHVPTAPGYCLCLDQAFFESYNEQKGDVHGSLELNEAEQAAKDKFKQEKLFPHIHSMEQKSHYMARWLRTLDAATIQDIPQYTKLYRDFVAATVEQDKTMPITKLLREKLIGAHELLRESSPWDPVEETIDTSKEVGKRAEVGK